MGQLISPQVLTNVPAFLLAVVIPWIVVFGLVAPFTARSQRISIGVMIAGLSILGGVAGFAGGLSRVGVVGDIIPAALALVGGVSVYLFGVDRTRGTIVSVGAGAFGLALLIGYASGAGNRVDVDRYALARDFCYRAMSDPAILGSDQAFCRFARTSGDLCAHMLHDQTWDIYYRDGDYGSDAARNADRIMRFNMLAAAFKEC